MGRFIVLSYIYSRKIENKINCVGVNIGLARLQFSGNQRNGGNSHADCGLA